jgi:hypothetical protein
LFCTGVGRAAHRLRPELLAQAREDALQPRNEVEVFDGGDGVAEPQLRHEQRAAAAAAALAQLVVQRALRLEVVREEGDGRSFAAQTSRVGTRTW